MQSYQKTIEKFIADTPEEYSLTKKSWQARLQEIIEELSILKEKLK